MKLHLTVLIVLPWLAASFCMAREPRVFTDITGRKITAELTLVEDETITLKRYDGKTFTIPLAKLSKEDREYSLDWRKRHESEMEEIVAKAEAVKLAAERRVKTAAFCIASMGKQVGNGECWTLADEAFKATGAERPAGESRVWGRLVDIEKESLEPGDIVEFRVAKITGYGTTGPEHTAVVVKGGRRGQCTLAEQNWSNVKKVREVKVNLRGLVSGEVMVYRLERMEDRELPEESWKDPHFRGNLGEMKAHRKSEQVMRCLGLTLFLGTVPVASAGEAAVLTTEALRSYVDAFNRNDRSHGGQAISNEDAADWMAGNVPLFECPDKEIEEIYHFRWWTFRKHIKETPDGFVITEFLPKVSWSGKHNTISCPAGHHFREGRWIREGKYLDDYSVFWFRKGGAPRRYSFWAADSIFQRALVLGDFSKAIELLPDLIANYREWEKSRLEADGLFWQVDDRDGMEVSIGGSVSKGKGKRATINSYMYGDALAIAEIAARADKPEIATEYREKAADLQRLVQEKLWDEEAKFFRVLPLGGDGGLVAVRELHGFTPWYFDLPEKGKGYEVAWKQLTDTKGFKAPYGPTTAERRHPGFAVSYTGHECQWNGPSWPFATSVTLTALANVLNDYPQDSITAEDYFEALKTYTKSHRLKRGDRTVVPWIDENLNPFTGDWISRTRLKAWKDGTWDAGKGGEERGKDYNHSTYCDLVISGLIGLRPRVDHVVEVHPLVPAGKWDWFCLDGLPYHGRSLTILYDKSGEKYGKGKGLRILADGKEIGVSETLGRLTAELPVQ